MAELCCFPVKTSQTIIMSRLAPVEKFPLAVRKNSKLIRSTSCTETAVRGKYRHADST